MDTYVLRSAYAELISEARQGGFGEPPEGEWNADQIIAHIAANDELLADMTQKVIDGTVTKPYYNHDAIDTARLNELIAEQADTVQWLERTSTALCELIERLSDDDATMVDLNIVDGTITRFDQPMPWSALLRIQAEMHLPRHIAQLKALRP